MRLCLAAVLVFGAAPAVAHDQWAKRQSRPSWIKKACCGAADAHRISGPNRSRSTHAANMLSKAITRRSASNLRSRVGRRILDLLSPISRRLSVGRLLLFRPTEFLGSKHIDAQTLLHVVCAGAGLTRLRALIPPGGQTLP